MRQVTVLKIHVLHIKLSQTHHLLCVGKFFDQMLRVTLCSGVHEQNVSCSVQTNCTLVVGGRLIKYACSSNMIGHVAAKLRNTTLT